MTIINSKITPESVKEYNEEALLADGFDGLLWPQRFIAFACGIIIFSILTWVLKGEGINTKTMISLILALCLVSIQVFWK